jgi:hypothetical protein
VHEVSIREPKGRDWKRWVTQEDSPKRTMGLLCDLTGLPEDIFDEMGMRDHARCIQAVEGFFATYQPEESRILKLAMTSPSFAAGLTEMFKS